MRYVFGDCTLDTEQYLLYRATLARPLQPKVFEVLHYLLTHRDRVIAKGELQAQVWPQQFISEATLEGVIKAVRHAVGDDGRTQWCIQTRRGQGYRFVAPVALVPGTETGNQRPLPTALSLPAERPSRSLVEADALPLSDRPALPASPGPALPDAERRQVTILFCDLVGSTALSGQLDPEDLRAVLQAYLETCAEVIARFGGNIDKFLGDGALVCFGYPQAHDDDPQRAVRAGLGIVDALAQVNPHLTATWGVQLAVRIGVHTGLVVAGDLAVGATHAPQSLVGEAPNIAARLQERAAPNTVVCSAATARLVEGYFTLESLGPQHLKGVARSLPVYRVVDEHGVRTRFDVARTRGLTLLVGRESEGALLRERWAAVKDGRGQVVLLSGEAGIGKSRLVQEFTAQLIGEASTQIACHCSPYYQHSAFYPVVAQLQRLLQWRPDAPPEEQLRALEDALRAYNGALEEVLPLVATLLMLPLPAHDAPLPLTPQHQRQKTLETLLGWLLQEAERQPVCVVVEDLHWGDPSTLELLSLLIAQLPTARVLLLLLFRPEFRPPWAVHSYCTHLALGRLSTRQTEAMVQQVVGDAILPAELIRQVVATTDGVPLFVEELTKMVLESGLGPARTGRDALTGPLRPLAIPATLHDSLLARLDRLGPAKQVAQWGAVVGREFPYEVLQAVAPVDEATLQQRLAQLVEAELLYQRGVPPQARYTFKHVLIQEAAYQSLLKSTRQQYHQQIAQVLETRFPHMAAAQPALLAHHALWGEVWDKAGTYFQQAGEQAVARSANREAVAAFEQALGALQHLPESRAICEQAIDLRLALDSPLWRLGDWGRVLVSLHEAEVLAERLGDQRRLAHISSEMADGFRILGDYERALRAGQRAVTLAIALEDGTLQVEAKTQLGLIYCHRGDYGRAIEALKQTVTALARHSHRQRDDHPDAPAVWARSWLLICFSQVGAFAEGHAMSADLLRLAEATARPFDLAVATFGVGQLALRQGDLSQAIAVFERGLATCQPHDLHDWIPTLAARAGYAYALAGRLPEALPLLEQAVGQYAAMRGGTLYTNHLVWLGEAYLCAGRLDEADTQAQSAWASARAHQEQGYEADALRLLGDIAAHRAPPDVDQAAVHYRSALALAEALGMRPLQAHCHRSLGMVYAKIGQAEQAQAALSTSIAMYQAMEMTFWLPETEAALAQVQGR